MNAMKNTKHNVSKSNKKVSTFWLVAIIFAIIVIISNIGGGSSTQHNYNDNSTTNRLLAKNYFGSMHFRLGRNLCSIVEIIE